MLAYFVRFLIKFLALIVVNAYNITKEKKTNYNLFFLFLLSDMSKNGWSKTLGRKRSVENGWSKTVVVRSKN